MRTTFRALSDSRYRRWAAADLVSVTGTWMGTLAIGWTVLERGAGALGLGATVLLATVPSLALGPAAGALADRVDPRQTVLATQSAKAAVMAGIATVVTLHGPIVMLQGLALLMGVIGVLDGPALVRFGSSLVTPAQLPACLAFGSVVNATGRILGMTLGGVLAAALGPAALLWCDAASFIAVLLTVASLRVTGQARHQTDARRHSSADDRGVRAGLDIIRRHPTSSTVLLLAVILGSLGRNFQVTMAAMADGPLHGSSAAYGLLSGAFAGGALVGALTSARLRTLRLRVLLGAASALALVQALSGALPALPFAAAMCACGGLAVVVDTAVASQILLSVPEHARGRASALLGTASAGAAGLGAVILGWLCDAAGARTALAIAGGITLACCVAAGLRMTKGRPHMGTALAAVPVATS